MSLPLSQSLVVYLHLTHPAIVKKIFFSGSFFWSKFKLYVYVCLFTSIYVYVRLYTSMYVNIRLCTLIYVYVRLCTSMDVYVRLCTSTYVYARLCTSTYVFVRPCVLYSLNNLLNMAIICWDIYWKLFGLFHCIFESIKYNWSN